MKGQRLKSIDIIKGIAIVMIVLVHFNRLFSTNITVMRFGQMGCQMFFVVSGFGVAQSFERKFASFSFRKATFSFYESRIKSIAPAYHLMMVIVYLVNTVAIAFTGSALDFGYNRDPLAILCNVFFLHGLVPSANNNVMFGGWYIGTTMLMYGITPLLFHLFERFKHHRKLVCAVLSTMSVAVLAAASKLFPQYAANLLDNNSFGYFSICTQLPCFGMGMLLYFEHNKEDREQHPIMGLIAGSGVLMAAFVLFFRPIIPYAYLADASLVGLATYFILKYMIHYETSHTYPAWTGVLTAFGTKSFFIYLTHPFVVYTCVDFAKTSLGQMNINADSYAGYFLLLVISLPLSYLLGCIYQKWISGMMNFITRYCKKSEIGLFVP